MQSFSAEKTPSALRAGLLIALGAAALLSSEMLYRQSAGIAQLADPVTEGLVILLLGVLFACSKMRITKVLIFLVFAVSSAANNIHFAVSGGWMGAHDLWLAFASIPDLLEAGEKMYERLSLPISWGAGDCMLFLIFFQSASGKIRFRGLWADAAFFALIAFLGFRVWSGDAVCKAVPAETGRAVSAGAAAGCLAGREIPDHLSPGKTSGGEPLPSGTAGK